MPLPRPAWTAILLLLTATLELRAEVILRWNQAGYRPDRPKSLVALSDADLSGKIWRIERENDDDATALAGKFAPSAAGVGDHSPFPFNHVVDFSVLTEPARYRFTVEGDGGQSAAFTLERAPYARLLHEPLQHLRLMRSGSHDTRLRKFSHPGDAKAHVFIADGDPASGKWKSASPARTVDALGGWYDAGDQIKFTLNNAYTTYHLLLAWRLKPSLFKKVNSRSDLPDILDEARHGLEFLARTFPDENTFIIQIGNELDHDQGRRLPENDPLDGKRPALCALARVQMGSAAAALALGARTFRELGKTEDATRYAAKALAIYERARRSDAVATAFERGEVNDFYRDATDADQMALAAIELYSLTGDTRFRDDAIALAPPAADDVGWADWNWLANAALAPSDPSALARLRTETESYAKRAATSGKPWSVPGPYVWASLHRWVGIANAARYTSIHHGASPERDALFFDMLDYVFGRNNWGVSFLHSRQLPNTLRHPYSPAYELLGVFPAGVFSEGPGDRKTHDSLARYFKIPADDPLTRFNSKIAVFHDHSSDFMCQEATIGGQADVILMLTLASLDASTPAKTTP